MSKKDEFIYESSFTSGASRQSDSLFDRHGKNKTSDLGIDFPSAVFVSLTSVHYAINFDACSGLAIFYYWVSGHIV